MTYLIHVIRAKELSFLDLTQDVIRPPTLPCAENLQQWYEQLRHDAAAITASIAERFRFVWGEHIPTTPCEVAATEYTICSHVAEMLRARLTAWGYTAELVTVADTIHHAVFTTLRNNQDLQGVLIDINTGDQESTTDVDGIETYRWRTEPDISEPLPLVTTDVAESGTTYMIGLPHCSQPPHSEYLHGTTMLHATSYEQTLPFFMATKCYAIASQSQEPVSCSRSALGHLQTSAEHLPHYHPWKPSIRHRMEKLTAYCA